MPNNIARIGTATAQKRPAPPSLGRTPGAASGEGATVTLCITVVVLAAVVGRAVVVVGFVVVTSVVTGYQTIRLGTDPKALMELRRLTYTQRYCDRMSEGPYRSSKTRNNLSDYELL